MVACLLDVTILSYRSLFVCCLTNLHIYLGRGVVVMAFSSMSPQRVVRALQELSIEKTIELVFHLGVDPNILKDIEKRCNPKINAIQTWLERDDDASWEKIVSGLKQIGMNALAKKVATRYCQPTTLHTTQPTTTPAQEAVTSSAASKQTTTSHQPVAPTPSKQPVISEPWPAAPTLTEQPAASDHTESMAPTSPYQPGTSEPAAPTLTEQPNTSDLTESMPPCCTCPNYYKCKNNVGITPCQKLLKQEGTARRIESTQQSSATQRCREGEDCSMLSILLAVPSCFNSFWHGVIPTSYFIFSTHFFSHK